MKQALRSTIHMSCLIGALGLIGCSSGSDDSSVSGDNDGLDQFDSTGMPTATLDDTVLIDLEGIWERRGYGNLYSYENNRTTWYTVTENTCLEVASFDGLIGLSADEVSQTRYALEGDELTIAFPGDLFVTQLQRQEEVPARCDETLARDAQGMFDFVWETFDEYYAFFNLRNVDWAAEYAAQLPRVGAAIDDDDALFKLLADLLSPIDDDRVILASPTDFFSPAVERGALVELRSSFEAQNEITDFQLFIDGVVDQFQQNIASKLDADSINEQGPLTWGTAEAGSVGYLFISSMDGYVVDADGEQLDNVSFEDEVAAAISAIDTVMTDLADTSRLIIDVRINTGGYDAIALEFARQFVSDRQLALSRTARSRDFESSPVEAWIEPPADGAYLQPVTLIIGNDTASAAEFFVIPMQRLPQVTVIGENTAGVLSNFLFKPLPNGWEMGLSNEVYFDADGVSFESVGVTPDTQVSVFNVDEIQAGMDAALDLALSMP